jgi:fatty acid amide hydrolase 2
MIKSRGSLLLILVFWPIALFTIILAQVQRFWAIGTIYCNASNFVSEDDDEVMDLILTKSGVELSKKIQNPNDPLSSVQLVKACIRQIKRTNVFLNAVVATRFEEALREAAEADLAVVNGSVPENRSFWGVPILVKECMEVTNMPYTAGMSGRCGIVGLKTGSALSQVENHGAIIIGCTNVSEGCMWHESFNQVYGRTYNPYDYGRTCGGSSGGCGAGVAACMAPMAITSDVGGSTRIPAFYNGLFGHKPSGGAISNDGTIPDVGTGEVRYYCQLGPTSKHSEDLWPLLNALLIPKSMIVTKAGDINAIKEVKFSTITVFETRKCLGNSLLLSTLHPEIDLAIGRTCDYLMSVGCSVRNFDNEVPEIFSNLNAFQIWSSYMHTAKKQPFIETIRDRLSPLKGVLNVAIQLIASVLDFSPHTFPALLLAIAEYVVDLAPGNTKALCEFGDKIKVLLHDKLKGNVVWILPSLPTPAPLHNESILRIFDTSNTSFFNVMQLPVTAVPMGLNADGLPIGIQVVAGYGNDHLSIAVACELQKGGLAKWVAPRAYQQ